MKRISALTLVFLLTFMGCARQQPQQESTTAPELYESVTESTAEVSTAEIASTDRTEQTITQATTKAVIPSVTTVFSTTKQVTTLLTTAPQTNTTSSATTQTTVTATHTTAVMTSAETTASATVAATTSSNTEMLLSPTSARPVLTTEAEAYITVTVICNCKNAVDYGIREKNPAIPESGIIINTTVTVKEGSTAMDAIKAACSKADVEITESRGYIKSIATLAEMDCGGASGWLYSVNSAFPNTSSDKYILKSNDTVALHYTVKNGDVTRI